MGKMSRRDVYRLVNDYIGVSGGYLGDFSYRTHEEFYYQYCELNIDVAAWRLEKGGTTREVFIDIMETVSPSEQAAIIEGVLAKYPAESFPEPQRASKRALSVDFTIIAAQLRSAESVQSPAVGWTSEVVALAISDAEVLLRQRGPASAVDRTHTALHGYLKTLCRICGAAADEDESMPRLFKSLRLTHPVLQAEGPRAAEIRKIMGSLAAIVEALNTLRNHASAAHPNDVLLDEADAHLAINAGRSLLHYLDAKMRDA